jgi:hypothetical protein
MVQNKLIIPHLLFNTKLPTSRCGRVMKRVIKSNTTCSISSTGLLPNSVGSRVGANGVDVAAGTIG